MVKQAAVRQATPLKIFLATPYGEDGMGGIDRLNDSIVEGFSMRPELGISCHRLVTRGKRSLLEAQAVFSRALAEFATAAVRQQVDVLHIHLSVRGSSYRKTILAKLARGLGIPYVVHLHGTEYKEFYDGTNSWLRGEINRMLGGSSRIIVLGEFWASVIRDLHPASAHKIMILPNATVAPAASHALPQHRSSLQITFLGQLGRRKGSADLLRALGSIRHLPGWTATVAGDGEIAAAKALAKQLGLDGHVIIPGWLSAEERSNLLAATDIFTLPSYAENLPMVVLEAFAHGVATITTPVGAIPEVVIPEQNGLLVQPGNIQELAKALERLILDPELRKRLGVAAKSDHRQKFEMKQYLVKLSAIWREVQLAGCQQMEESRAAV